MILEASRILGSGQWRHAAPNMIFSWSGLIAKACDKPAVKATARRVLKSLLSRRR